MKRRKRLIALFVLALVFSFSLPAGAAALGDVNNSGSIDIVDALLVAQYYVGLNPQGFDPGFADVNCSGAVDIVDALVIAQYYVGLITSFPCSPTAVPTGVVTATPTTGPTNPPLGFVTRSGSKLYDGSKEFRFVSVNIPNYFIVEDQAGNTGASWHRVTEFEQRDACEAVKRAGGQLFRTYVFSIQGGANVQNNLAHITGSGGNLSYNEDLFKDADRGIAIAKEKGLRMYIPLIDNWQWFGGYAEFANVAGGGDFWTSATVKAKFKEFINWLVNRTNTVTGVKYKDEPAIMGWELGNEIDKANDTWIGEMASYIKSVDTRHLVIDGSHKSIPAGSLNSSSIDVCTTHYTDADISANTQKAAAAGKAYVYGEFSIEGDVAGIINTVRSAGASGCLIWSLRFRTDVGGFYFHSDFNGDSLQYPGFSDNQPSNEAQIWTSLRNNAFQIQGLSVPTDPVPDAPVLLAISSPSQISWKGSAGAKSYIVQRSDSASGTTWSTLASGVSDAKKNGNVAALPLYNDNPPAGTWYYRIIAVNDAGQSTPSNTVSMTR